VNTGSPFTEGGRGGSIRPRTCTQRPNTLYQWQTSRRRRNGIITPQISPFHGSCCASLAD